MADLRPSRTRKPAPEPFASRWKGRSRTILIMAGLTVSDLLERAMERLVVQHPDRAARLGSLTHVLPPRPGGVLALLESMSGVDVVVIAHAGLDRFASFTELARAVPLRDPVAVTAWRVAAADIPTDADGRIGWLDDQWRRVDDWVGTHLLQAPST